MVGGAVRDELLGVDSKDADFLVPGVDIAGLRGLLEPHGRTEELVVAGRSVGVRHYPRDRALRALVPAGIELAPPRREVSTGPGRHDFEIVADPSLSVEDDMRRRDFTVNAMARRLETGELVDPLGGRADLEARRLRTVSPQSRGPAARRAQSPLRLLISTPTPRPSSRCARATGVRLVSGERLGGGLHADGMGELSKLLLGKQPAKALRIARDTGVLVEVLPEFPQAIGFQQESRYHDLTVDEHTFAVVQAAADGGASLAVRLAALFHDLGKPHVAWRGTDDRLHYYAKPGYSTRSHEQVSAELAAQSLARLRYPNELRSRVIRIVRAHMFDPARSDPVRARRMLSRYGRRLTFELLDHKGGRSARQGRHAAAGARAAGTLPPVDGELKSPHRLRDLRSAATTCARGYPSGPIGRALQSCSTT